MNPMDALARLLGVGKGCPTIYLWKDNAELQAAMARLVVMGYVESAPPDDSFSTAWRLTPLGRSVANLLPPPEDEP